MHKLSQDTSARRYDLDKLRVIAIVILLFYHTGMIYVSWDWHIKSAEHSRLLEYLMVFSHFWRMPLLFFISGAGTYYAFRARRAGGYVAERFKRLFLPLVFGMFVVVPPQIYYERLFRGQTSDTYLQFYPEVFELVAYPAGALSWHHLWFVAYLFLYAVASVPLFICFEHPRLASLREALQKFFGKKGAVLLLVLPILVEQAILEPLYPEETHALTDDWAYFGYNWLYFLFGYMLTSLPLAQQLAKQRHFLLGCTLVPTALMYYAWLATDNDTFFDVAAIFTGWFSVVATIAYGAAYLNKPAAWLKPATEMVYPFYILHQTLIIIIGYYVLRFGWPVWGGFWFVSLATAFTAVTLYWYVLRNIPVVGQFFGGK